MSPADLRLIERAAERWGKRKPSPDEIIAARWPKYNEDQIHTAGYHDMMEAVYEQVHPPKFCAHCGGQIYEGKADRIYCCSECTMQAGKNYKPVEDPQVGVVRPASEKAKERVAELFASMIDEEAA